MKALKATHIIEFNKYVCAEYGIDHVILNLSLAESAVGAAFFEMEEIGYVHGNIPEIAAALCFKIIKNHAFADGNKRTAALASLAFLDVNNCSLSYIEGKDSTEFQRIIESVADNSLSEMELKNWFVIHVKQ